jgi:hypothetical protein
MLLRAGMGRSARSLALAAAVVTFLSTSVWAHRSGCHRWHSCPSDTGSYICGDTGRCFECPDNQYCEAAQPRRTSTEEQQRPGQPRPGAPPASKTTCPADAPIKGYFTPSSGERCIYHMPNGQYYGRTRPGRCYATEAEATRDGCRPSSR